MSNLLERAIIDAKALKEAAMKTAEQSVIEKYSEEVRKAVDSILEQEDLGLGTDPTPAGAEDISLPGLEEEPADPAADPAAEDPEAQALDPESLVGSVPDAFNSDDDEIITIKLDSLEAEMEDEIEGPFATGDELGDNEIGIDILDDLEIDTDDDYNMGEFEMDSGSELEASPEGPVGSDITEDIVNEVLSELGVDSDEIDIDDVLEAVRVDFEPQKSGWAGTPEPQMREYESMLLAREQDTEVKEENEELRKTVAALQKENKTITTAATKLQKQNKEYETAFTTLQEKLETMNVSNAKLLYINQALENASLNERQKRKIVEAISKADTVQEAKIVFDTMNDAVSTTLDVKKDSTLNEVVSRKSSLLVAARNEQKSKNANPMYNRLQRLAGIKTQKS